MRPIGILTLAIGVLGGAVEAGTVLVRDGQPSATIVTPAGASKTVVHAAGQLAEYMKQITGAEIAVVAEGGETAGVPIHVGPTAKARAALPKQVAADPDGVFVSVDAQRVVICGGSDRGTLYGVYRFLEQAIGCRWLAHDQEYVPTKKTVELDALRVAVTPAFQMRVFNGRPANRAAWGAKLGMNGFYTAEARDQTGNGYYLPKQAPSCHVYYKMIPSKKYFKKHPEWFPLLQGQRRPGGLHGGQLCVTAAGLADEFAANVIKVFDADPSLQVMSISPNDGCRWCECEACLALDKKLCAGRTTKQGLAGDRPFMGDRVFWFSNEVAKRVGRKHPDKLLLVLAYVNYAEPPDTIVPADNVVPWLCHYAPADYSRPIADPTSEANAQFNALLRRWARSAPHLLFYSYVSKSMWWRLPRPVVRTFAADVKYLHSLGVRRYYCQSTLYDWPIDGPLYYVIAKLLWDPAADPNAIAADWVRHMFGTAAGPMARYYAAVDQSVRASGQSFSDNPPRHVPGLYDPADLDRAQAALAEAAKAADSDVVRERIAKITRLFVYGRHMIRCLEAAHAFNQTPTRESLRTTVAEGEKALEIYPYKYIKRFLSSIQRVRDLGVVAKGFGDTEELGGRKCWNSDETGPGDNKSGWATLAIETPDTSKAVRLEIDVWGKSSLSKIVVNTGGQRRGYDAGGVWKPVEPEQALSGKEEWNTLVFSIPPELLAPGLPVQMIGMGGADSQIWIAAVRVKSVEK